jgi:hypothetical protein
MKVSFKQLIIRNNDNGRAAYNVPAVWRNGGSSPQTILCEIQRYYPAASSVEAATELAAGRYILCEDSAIGKRHKQKKKKSRYLSLKHINRSTTSS